MKTILLTEELSPLEANMITESSQDGKNVWLSGIFCQAGIKNRNGRVYPLSEMAAAVKSIQQKIVENNGVFGELDHPPTLTINLDRISHVITELQMDGNNGIGRAKIIDTPMGNIAKSLIGSGVKMGVSTRGAGQVSESGDVSHFSMVTADLVATPSAPGAQPSTIYESLDLAKNGKLILDLAESVRHDPKAQKYLKTEILKWLNQGVFAKK